MTTTSRPALESDVPFLLRLRKRTMDAHLAASGANTADEKHIERLMYRFECAEILLQDGLPIGLLKVARDPNEWKVIQIQIAPHLQGQGLGAQILNGVIEQARAAGAELVLSVLKANPARALYERLGFVVEGEDDHEYFMRLPQGLA
jgi:ribosomal protein S18 acetylase RimI-like enzyme